MLIYSMSSSLDGFITDRKARLNGPPRSSSLAPRRSCQSVPGRDVDCVAGDSGNPTTER
jgi:hypothetical protein